MSSLLTPQPDTGRHHMALGVVLASDASTVRTRLNSAVRDARLRPAHPSLLSGYYAHVYLARHAEEGPDGSSLAVLNLLLDGDSRAQLDRDLDASVR